MVKHINEVEQEVTVSFTLVIGFKYLDGINHSGMDVYMCNAT